MSLQIFDGPNIRDIDPAEVEALDDQTREVLMDTLQKARAAEAGENRLAAARISVRNGMQNHDAALAEYNATQKRVSHADALRQVIAAGLPGYRPVKPGKASAEQTALDRASVALAENRSELEHATRDYKILSAARAEAIMAWIAAQSHTVTPLSNARAHINAQQQRRIDVAAGTADAPQIVEPVRQNEIDRVLSARGRAQVR